VSRRLRGLLRVATAATALLSIFAPCAAFADPAPRAAPSSPRPTSALSWVRLPGAESCLAASELSTRVEAKLGRAVFVSPSLADLLIEARAELVSKKNGYRVVVTGTRRDGTALGSRELAGPDCKSLEEGLVLILALMIDRDASPTGPPAPASPPTEIVRERVILREVHDAAPTAAPTEPVAPLTLDVVAAFDLALARSPSVAPALFLGGTLGVPHFVPIELALDLLPSSSATTSAHEITVSEVAGDLSACPRWEVARVVRAGVCAGVRLGAFSARGTGFPAPHDETALLADVRVAPRLDVDLASPFFLYASGGLAAPLARQRVSFASADGSSTEVYARPAVGGDVALGVGVRFRP
jgi:hypothetical protein